MEVVEKLDYTLIGYTNGNKIYAELGAKILKISWNGIVELKSLEEILYLASQLIDDHICDKIILDRENLKGFTVDAQKYIKSEMILKVAPKLVMKVKKIATIKPTDKEGASISSRITDAIINLFPQLIVEEFQSMELARAWISS